MFPLLCFISKARGQVKRREMGTVLSDETSAVTSCATTLGECFSLPSEHLNRLERLIGKGLHLRFQLGARVLRILQLLLQRGHLLLQVLSHGHSRLESLDLLLERLDLGLFFAQLWLVDVHREPVRIRMIVSGAHR